MNNKELQQRKPTLTNTLCHSQYVIYTPIIDASSFVYNKNDAFYQQDGFEKMEVTGRFELPEELLDLERSGINEASAFERSRARRAISQAPSPPLGKNASAREMYGLDGEASR